MRSDPTEAEPDATKHPRSSYFQLSRKLLMMRVKCHFCEMFLVSEDHLAPHVRMHTEGHRRPFHCPDCSFSASRKDVVSTHMKTHREGILYYCLHCPFIASNMTAFTRHKKVHSNDPMCLQLTDSDQDESACSPQRNFGGSSEYTSEMDGHSLGNLLGRRQYHPKFDEGLEEDRMESLLQPEISIQVKQELLYACPVCNFNTTSNLEMEEHLDEAEEDQLYTCDECDSTFCSFRSATIHREIHLLEDGNSTDENNNGDVLVPYTLPAPALENHSQERNHLEGPMGTHLDLPMQMDPMLANSGTGTMTMYLEPSSVGDIFNFSEVYDESSDGEFSDEDETCDPDWKPSGKLRRKRAKVTNPHPDPVMIVPVKSDSPSSAPAVPRTSPKDKVQIKSETPKKVQSSPKTTEGKGRKKASPKHPTCMFCNKIFSCPSSLNLHIRIHTGERPFKCHKCSFSSSQKGNLRTHLKTHTGILVKCSLCNYTGTNTSTVNAHIRTDHPGGVPSVKSTITQSPIKPKTYVAPAAVAFNTNKQFHDNNRKRINKYRSRSLAWAVKSQRAIAVKQEPLESSKEVEVKPKILNSTVPIPNSGFYCPMCNITCKSVETFRRHDCTQKRFGCSHCSYTCRTLYHLRRHWSTHKSGILESCPECPFQTSSSRGLTRHVREVHEGRMYKPKASSPQI
ncbi:unnamed protein product [Allacma fusca]|uniref:C2H2-type domain-containing protein n=1 Tax=Allacma fusca TaxID=39272 RepID=A0A8J2L7A1_9HEXA|nr:unnamed protein product [Allacma fusca]